MPQGLLPNHAASELSMHQNGSAHPQSHGDQSGAEAASSSSSSSDVDSDIEQHASAAHLAEVIAEPPSHLAPINTPSPRVSISRHPPATLQAASHGGDDHAKKSSQASGPKLKGASSQRSERVVAAPQTINPLQPNQVPTFFSPFKPGLASPQGEQLPQNLLPEFDRQVPPAPDASKASASQASLKPNSHRSHVQPLAAHQDEAGPSGISPEERRQLDADRQQPADLTPNPKRDVAERRKLERATSSECWASSRPGPIDQASPGLLGAHRKAHRSLGNCCMMPGGVCFILFDCAEVDEV